MKKLLILSLMIFAPFIAHANWTLNSESSSVNFISIKKSSVGEVHKFNSMSGSLINGEAKVLINLSSVDTKIPIRNERMKKMLFEVAKFASATVSATIDTAKADHLKAGDSYQEIINLKLDLHGIVREISSDVQVIMLSNNRVLVHSMLPVILNASDFGLEGGVEALRTVAKLPVISTAVPVTFNLVFEK